MERTELMVMLTHHDETVGDAYELFESSKDLPVYDWGFKNVGICEYDTVDLISAMKAAGKNTFYEIITRKKEAYIIGETTAERAKFGTMMGTKYDEQLCSAMHKLGIKFCPAVGQPGSVYKGQPGVLLGAEDEIKSEALHLVNDIGVDGITLPAFRYYLDGYHLLQVLREALPDTPIYVAGSVDSFEKIDEMFQMGIAKFTMGSALFNKKFAPQGSFRDNLEVVANYIESKYPRG